MTDALMRMPESAAVSFKTPHTQQACHGCEEEELRQQPIEGEEEEELQAKPISDNDRAFFEPRFNRDFSRVRLHTDAKVAESARAFTVGQDVVFGIRQYAPETILGRDFPNIKNRISSPEVVNTSGPRIDSKYQVR